MITPEQAQDMLHYEGADGFTAPELCLTAELAARAPVMAEQIANMHYEYAVQVFEGGWWRTLGLRGTYKQAVALANLWRGDTCRVARRLATDWEVAE